VAARGGGAFFVTSFFRFVPEQASTVARSVDALLYFLLAVSGFFSLLIATLIVVFGIRYHRRSPDELPPRPVTSTTLEVVWTVIPLGLVMIMYAWGASLFFTMSRPPADAMEIQVVGKQWMWKFQHLTGQREINELHVPLGLPVRLTMTSEDVIHSFFVPAFRTKMDVIPGRYTTAWFEATKVGRFHLFCAEYCGTQHSGMGGWVEVMEPAHFQRWLAGAGPAVSLAEAGAELFQRSGCQTCHRSDRSGQGPPLEGIFGRPVTLEDGTTVTADERYLRESIVRPMARIVRGYQPVMPTYQGVIGEEGILQLIAYIKSLEAEGS
jgi:cytochrome c oxidase subunit 2